MKKFYFALTALLFFILNLNDSLGQSVKTSLPMQQANGQKDFYSIQKEFYKQTAPYNIDRNGYYIDENGEEKRVPGYKQFKRWEWYWETRVDKTTGDFPQIRPSDIYMERANSGNSSRSASGSWSSLGPTASAGGYYGLGRLNCIGFRSGDNNTYYVGSPSGGLWKTTDDGSSWTVLTDDNPVLGVSEVVVLAGSTTSNDTLYIGTGDRDGGSIWSLGGGQTGDNNSIGVLKSVDGGATWNTTGLSFQASEGVLVNRLIVNPDNHNILYAATTNGLYKTTDGGGNWTLLSNTDFYDLEFKPGDPQTMYAGGNTSGSIYLSTDGGATWTEVLTTNGYRVVVGVSPNQSTWAYAAIVYSDGYLKGFYKSETSGSSWSLPGDWINLMGANCDGSGRYQGWYDLALDVDPTNANIVFTGGINTWKTSDGGVNWHLNNHWYGTCGGSVPEVHADKHYLKFQNGTATLFECNDGGVYKTTDGGTNWNYKGSGIVSSQIYRLGVSQTASGDVIAGLQDNGTKSINSGTWEDVLDGDGMDCDIDYTDNNLQYGESQYGNLRKTTNHWTTSTDLGFVDGRWVSPFAIDPTTHTTLYFGATRSNRFDPRLHKSTDGGSTWSIIGSYDFREFAVAPSNSDYIFGVNDDGVYKTDNGGSSWSDITGTLPVNNATPTYVSVKYDDPNTAWVTFGQYNNYSVYQTTDGGTSWMDISYGLPSAPVMCIVHNRQNTSETELYAGTDVGVYVKYGTAPWQLFSTGLPNVVITELKIYYDDATPANSRIRAATYGRGVWESDLYTFTAAAPIADFIADDTVPIPNQTVTFNDFSSNQPTSWQWTITPSSFQYLDGTSATSQYPKVQFTALGYYTIQLTVSNASGSDTKTRTSYINVGTYHNYCSASGGGSDYIESVETGDISNTNTASDGYHDYKSFSTAFYQGQAEIPITISNGLANSTYDVSAWIDFNRNGTFDESTEKIVCQSNTTTNPGTYYFDVPVDADTGATVMRVRIKRLNSSCGSPCGATTYGEVEDYSIQLNEMPACPPPSYQIESNLTGTSVDLGWSQIGTVSSWDIRLVTAGTDTTGTGYSTTISNPLTVDTLTGNTDYQWYVRSSCGSAWIGPSSFHTSCTSLTAPVSENFDGVSAPDLPNCWTKIVNTTSGYSYVQTSTYNPNSSPNSVIFYNNYDTTGTFLLITPQLTDLPTQQNMITFYAKGADGGEAFIVGTMTDPSDESTFTPYKTITLTDTYIQYKVYFGSGYTLNDTYIAFKHGMNDRYLNIYFDDFVYTAMPACPEPSDLAADSISDTAAKLSWTENGSATSWQLRIVTSGTDTTGLGYSTVTANPLWIDTLLANTSYDWYVRGDCAGEWSAKATFSTMCSSRTAPFSENFDGVNAPALPDCWSSIVYSDYTQAAVKTYTYSYPHSSPNHILMNDDGGANGALLLITPELSDLTSQLNQIRFYAKCNSAGEKLIVGTMTDASDTATFTAFKTIPLTTDYTEYTVMFGSSYSESDSYIAFKHGENGDGYYNNIFIDDFVYEPMPTCPPVSDLEESNITTTSATLSWTKNGTETSWDVRIVTKDSDTTGTPYATKTSTMIIVDTLAANTYYDWYVRSGCGSDWAKSTFVTDCGTYSAPYSMNFDNETVPDIPHCWSTIVSSSSSYAKIETLTSQFPNSTPNHVVMDEYNDDNATLLLISPQFTDLTTQQRQITFYAKANNDGDSLMIGTMSDPAVASTFTRFKKISLTNTYTQYTVMFGATYTLNDEYIAFKHGGGGTYKKIYIDDIVYNYMPVNPPPSDLYETNITQTSAQLGWTENGTATSWDVRIVLENADTAGVAYATTSNNPFTVDTLNSNTRYDWYVREQGSENWAGPSTFITDCGDYTATYSEDFDNVTAPDIPHCFSTIVNSTSNYATVETNTSGEHSYPNHVRMYNANDANATLILISPQFSDLTSQQNEVRFYGKGYSGVKVILGTIDNPANASGFTAIDTIELTSTYTEYTRYFGAGYTGTDEYIAFKLGTGSSSRTAYIDDFVYEPMPACPHPSNQSESNITTTSAMLHWLENGSSTSWDVRIVPEGADTAGVGYTTTTANPFTVDTLTSATYYDWYVRSSCGSDWIGPNTFVTDCDTYSATFSENFDGVTVPELPICWSSINNSQYPTSSYVKTVNNHNPNSAPNHVEMYNYYDRNATLLLISPQLSDLTSQHNQIRFYAKGYYNNYTLIVGTMSDPSDETTFTPRKTFTLSNTYAEYKVYFGGTYTLSDEYIAFKHGSTDRYQMIEIDDIHYEPITDCLTPLDLVSQNINSSTEILSWTEQGNATSWNIRILPYGTDTTGKPWSTVTANPLTVDTLSAATQYTWYVRAGCGGNWSVPGYFTTECAPITTFPFTEGFENSVPPQCWHNTIVVNGNISPNWSQASSSSYPNATAIKGNYMALYNGKNASEGTEARLSTPQMDFTGLSGMGLTFWLYHSAISYPDTAGIIVQASVNGGTWTDVTPRYTVKGSNGWSKYAVNLKDYDGTANVSIGFLANGGNQINSYIDSVTVVSNIPVSATWTGAVDTSWYEAANWNTATIPFDTTHVVIPATVSTYPHIVSEGAVCRSLTIKSNSNGDGGLNGTEYLDIRTTDTVERFIDGGKWHDVATMMNNETVNSFFFNHQPDVWMNSYDEATGTRTAIIDLTTPMPLGHGFEAWVETGYDTVVKFTGDINTSDITVNLSYTDDSHGYNLIGNPFSAPICFYKGIWSLLNVDFGVWVWDPDINNYRAYTGAGGTLTNAVIPMGQGFFVHARGSNPSLTIPKDSRLSTSAQFYKKGVKGGRNEAPHVSLSVNKDENKDIVWIAFKESCTTGFDHDYDAEKLKGADESPQLYTVEGERHYTIDALPVLAAGEQRTVPLNFKAGTSGTHTLIAEDLNTLPNTEVVLEDLKSNTLQLLNENPVYQFTATGYQPPERFLIHFNRSVNGIDENEDDKLLSAYSYDHWIYVVSDKDLANTKIHMDIYNLSGQKILEKDIPAGILTKVFVPVKDNYVIVHLFGSNRSYTNKVFIK